MKMVEAGKITLKEAGEKIEEYPSCCLMAAMDDANGKLLAAQFFPVEGTSCYFWLLK